MYKYKIYLRALVFILVLMLILIFASSSNINHDGESMHYVSIVLGAILFVFGVNIVVRLIYRPITRIQKAFDMFNTHTDKSEEILHQEGAIFPFANEIVMLMRRIKASLEGEHYANILKRQAELAALQSQISPHFLYNTLDSIRGQVIEEGVDGAGDALEALSMLFRYSIDQSDNLITFEQELENTYNYIKIIKYRFSDRFDIYNEFDETSNEIMGYELPRLTLQPIIENAINHGLQPKRDRGKIVIRVRLTQTRFLISIEDNGIGIDVNTLDALNLKLQDRGINRDFGDKGSGIALINVNDRIRLKFGNGYGIHVNSLEGLGTEVHISLPNISKDN